MIQCTLRQIAEFTHLPQDPANYRSGRYLKSTLPLPGYGTSKWAFACYIKPLEWLASEKETIEGCIEFLNAPPLRRKYQRRQKEPLFGKLDPSPDSWTMKEIDGEKYFITILITNRRKSELLWGEGLDLRSSFSPGTNKRKRK